jgi:hypothetical protein
MGVPSFFLIGVNKITFKRAKWNLAIFWKKTKALVKSVSPGHSYISNSHWRGVLILQQVATQLSLPLAKNSEIYFAFLPSFHGIFTVVRYSQTQPTYYIAYSVICTLKQAIILTTCDLSYCSYGNWPNRVTPPHLPRAVALLLRYIPLQTCSHSVYANVGSNDRVTCR